MEASALTNRHEKSIVYLSTYASILLAVIPVLSPYSVLSIPITLVLGLALVVLLFFQKRNQGMTLRMEKKYSPLAIYVLLSAALSINGLIALQGIRSLVNSIVMMIVELVIYMVAWKQSDRKRFIVAATAVGYFACLYALYQLLMRVTGHATPMGRIPFLQVSGTWVRTTWGFRFNSIFSEPSYFAIYLLPLFTYHLFHEKWIHAIVIAFFVLLSSSSLGIAAVLVVGVWYLLFPREDGGRGTHRLAVVLLIVVLILGLFWFIPALNNIFTRTVDKIMEILTEDMNDNIRMKGYIDYFSLLPLKEKLLGVGFSQLQNYFAEHGYVVYNYSNAFVLTLLNSGLVGMAVLLYFLVKLFLYSRKSGTVPFFIILLMIMASDSVNLSYRFYWPLYFIFACGAERRKEKP